MRKKIGVYIFISFFILLFNVVETNAETNNFFVIDKTDTLEQSDLDKISNIGEMLSYKDVNLIFNIATQNPRTNNEESKSIYYDYIKKQSTFKKTIVVSYYTEAKELVCYDDYGVFSEDLMKDTQKTLKQFQNLNTLKEGIVYSYQTFSKILNDTFSLKIKSIDDIVIENPFKVDIFKFKNAILIVLVLTLLISFRRNKEFK